MSAPKWVVLLAVVAVAGFTGCVSHQRSSASTRTRHSVEGAAATYAREYFDFGATAISVFWESRTGGQSTYVFSGDINGDGGTSNDGAPNDGYVTIGGNEARWTFSAIQSAAV